MTPSLIEQPDAPAVSGMRIPHEFYRVAMEPAPLAGMRLPSDSVPWDALFALGFRWVVCLCSERPRYDPSPLKRLATVELCDLVDGDPPADPAAEEQLIREIADSIRSKLDAGEGVAVHCAGGRGRTGTVLGVVLRKLGLSGEEIVNYLHRLHRLRGKPGWPEAAWQSDLVRRAAP